MTIGFARRRAKRRWLAVAVGATALVLTAATLVLGSVASDSGFQGADGNLEPGSGLDWNSFAGATWTGTAPYQTATNAGTPLNGWTFTGLTDALATNSDTGFAGGTKQDDDCARVIGTKSPNKDDLKRVYLASKTEVVNNESHVFLALAWERIPQNSTTASAHVGFEFNQGTYTSNADKCSGSNLVKRTAGDLLFVYDFTGGSAGVATLTVRKWTTTPGDPCDIGSDAAPCWGVAQDLTASGFAEAAVDSGGSSYPFPVSDSVAIGSGSPARTAADSLGQSEFGEAVADLTGAGVFTPNTCLTLGQVEAVSRSSGNSGNAQMEDLVGPQGINISNCGTVKVIKHTDPGDLDQGFGFTTTIPSSGDAAATFSKPPDTTGASSTTFALNDHGTDTETITDVQPGSYTVTEGTEPTGFRLKSLSCTDDGASGSSGSQHTSGSLQADITVTSGGTVTCTYVNEATGTIKIIKHTDPRGVDQDFDFTASTGLSPSSFKLNDTGNSGGGDSAGNTETFSNVPVGSYSVTEGSEPTGFQLESVSCTTGGSRDSSNDRQANITLTAGATVTCTFTNEQQGTVKIVKHTDPGGLDQSFSYTTTLGDGSGFSLNDKDSTANSKTYNNVPPDDYTVTEGKEPAGFSLESLTCTDDGTSGSSGTQHAADSPQADITVKAGGSVTCTYVNEQLYGAILITKTSSKASVTRLDGAVFNITGPGSYSSGDLTTADHTGSTGDGTVCVDGLVFGTYTVTEKTAPNGYAVDDGTGQTVKVGAEASCADVLTAGATITFTDTPLTDLTVTATSQVADGTKSTITCKDSSGTAIGTPVSTPTDPATFSVTDLTPDTYTCTIVVDP